MPLPFQQHHVARHPEPAPEPEPVQTIVSIVYVTASPTFSGPIAGYSTVGPSLTHTNINNKPVTNIVVDQNTPPAATHTSFATSLKDLPALIVSPSSTVATTQPLLVETSSSSLSSSSTQSTVKTKSTSNAVKSTASSTDDALSATSTSNPYSPSYVPPSSGMGGTRTAGMIVGTTLVLFLVFSLILLARNRYKKSRYEERGEILEDEKHDFPAMDHAKPCVTTSNAPQITLQTSTPFDADVSETPQGRKMTEKKSPPINMQNSDNPFGNHAETLVDPVNATGPHELGQVNPRNIPDGNSARGASRSGPKPLDFTKTGPFMGPPSPCGTEFSVSFEAPGAQTQTPTAAAIMAAGGPVTAVHRVQLDFSPSMADELELRAGQLIRLLHEYDDGWAMCIRLDRSQQGVCPRTCLSTRPVKARPHQGGSRGPPQGSRIPVNPHGHYHQPRPMPSQGPQVRNFPQAQPHPAQNSGAVGPESSRPSTANGMPHPQAPGSFFPPGQLYQPTPVKPAGQAGPFPMSFQDSSGPRSMTPQGPLPNPPPNSGSSRPDMSNRPRTNSEAPVYANVSSPSLGPAPTLPRVTSPPAATPINVQPTLPVLTGTHVLSTAQLPESTNVGDADLKMTGGVPLSDYPDTAVRPAPEDFDISQSMSQKPVPGQAL